MIFYLFLFLISSGFIGLGEHNKSHRKVLYGIGILLPSLIAAFRGSNVGYDTLTYIERYETFISTDGLYAVISVLDTELFFLFSCFLAKYIGGYPLVFFLYSFFTQYFLLLALNRYKNRLNIWLGYLIFLFFFYNASLNIMRQILAIAYILYATTFLLDGNRKRYFIMTVISTTLHITAIIAGMIIFLIYKVSNIKKKYSSLGTFFYVIGLFISFMMVNVVITFMASIGYGNSFAYVSGMAKSVISYTDVLYSIIFIVIAFNAYNNKIISKKYSKFFYLSSLACLFLFLTGIYNGFLTRMALYILVFLSLLLPLIANSKKLYRYRKVYTLGYILFAFAYWVYSIVICGSNITIPYTTCNGISFI